MNVVTRGGKGCTKLYSLEDFTFIDLVYAVVFG